MTLAAFGLVLLGSWPAPARRACPRRSVLRGRRFPRNVSSVPGGPLGGAQVAVAPRSCFSGHFVAPGPPGLVPRSGCGRSLVGGRPPPPRRVPCMGVCIRVRFFFWGSPWGGHWGWVAGVGAVNPSGPALSRAGVSPRAAGSERGSREREGAGHRPAAGVGGVLRVAEKGTSCPPHPCDASVVATAAGVAAPIVPHHFGRFPGRPGVLRLRKSTISGLSKNYISKLFRRPDISYSGGLGGHWRPRNPPKRWGAKPPTFLGGFPAAWGRPDPRNGVFPVGQRIIYHANATLTKRYGHMG